MASHPTPHQLEALAAYAALMEHSPDLFRARTHRRFVFDRDVLIRYAVDNGVVLGVMAETPHLWLLNDLVATEQQGGSEFIHPYLRMVAPPGSESTRGVVVMATLPTVSEGDLAVVLVEQERHATGTIELEMPRGFGSPDRDSTAQARLELEEETGYVGSEATLLGSSITNSGIADAVVDYVHVTVSRTGTASPEPGEGSIRVRTVPIPEVWRLVRAGTIRDGFTLQALALYVAGSAESSV